MENYYWDYIEDAYMDVSIYDGPRILKRDLANYSNPIIDLLSVHWFLSEMSNGGIMQFYTNSTGILAPEVVKAFSRMNLDNLSDLMSESTKFFGHKFPRDNEQRIKALLKVANCENISDLFRSGLFDDIERVFYEFGGSNLGKIYDVMDSFANQKLANPRST